MGWFLGGAANFCHKLPCLSPDRDPKGLKEQRQPKMTAGQVDFRAKWDDEATPLRLKLYFYGTV